MEKIKTRIEQLLVDVTADDPITKVKALTGDDGDRKQKEETPSDPTRMSVTEMMKEIVRLRRVNTELESDLKNSTQEGMVMKKLTAYKDDVIKRQNNDINKWKQKSYSLSSDCLGWSVEKKDLLTTLKEKEKRILELETLLIEKEHYIQKVHAEDVQNWKMYTKTLASELGNLKDQNNQLANHLKNKKEESSALGTVLEEMQKCMDQQTTALLRAETLLNTTL